MKNKIKYFAFCLIAATLILIPNSSYSLEANYQKEFDTGKKHFLKGEFFQAIFNLQKSIHLTENSDELYESHFYLGLSYFMVRNSIYKDAFSNAVKIKPFKKIDPEFFSPQIIQEYNLVRDEILKDKNGLLSSQITDFFKTTTKSKFSTSIEYADYLRELKADSIDTIVSDYKLISFKGEYALNEYLSGYIEIGNITLALPAQYGYGHNTPGYGSGLSITFNIFKYANLNLKGEYFTFHEKSKNIQNYESRETKWNETRAGIFMQFFKENQFSPYIGYNKFFVNGNMNYININETELHSAKLKHINDGSSTEYATGLKMNFKDYFLDAHIKTTAGKKENYEYFSSFKLAAGYAF